MRLFIDRKMSIPVHQRLRDEKIHAYYKSPPRGRPPSSRCRTSSLLLISTQMVCLTTPNAAEVLTPFQGTASFTTIFAAFHPRDAEVLVPNSHSTSQFPPPSVRRYFIIARSYLCRLRSLPYAHRMPARRAVFMAIQGLSSSIVLSSFPLRR